ARHLALNGEVFWLGTSCYRAGTGPRRRCCRKPPLPRPSPPIRLGEESDAAGATAPRLPARTPPTSVARARGGWPGPGSGRGPGREGGGGFRAPLGRRSPRRDWRSTTVAPASPLRRGAIPRPAVATASGRPRRPGGTARRPRRGRVPPPPPPSATPTPPPPRPPAPPPPPRNPSPPPRPPP